MWTGVVCGLLAGAMWGMVFVVPELLSAFTPLEMAVGRYVAYGAIALGLMLPRLLADAVLVLHLAFVAFAVAGGLLAWRWRWMPWLHLPALAWAATVEFTGWICPLTPLENALRAAGGQAGYSSGSDNCN